MSDLVQLGTVVDINPESISRDFPFDEIEYVDISSVGSGTSNEPRKISIEEAPSRAKRLVNDGDTILSTVRPNRRSFLYIKNSKPNTVVSTGFAVLRANEKIEERYLYYLINHQTFTDYLTNRAKGAAYPAVDTEIISNAEIPLPTLPTQRKIAGVLSAYDDLIENNTRRIAILEELAQRIYKEWFVDFKYPGHENDTMVDSEMGMIPEGWEVKRIGEILISLGSGSRPKGGIDPNETEIPSIGAENILGLGKYDYSKEKYINREFFEGMRKGHVKSGDVLLYKDGAKLGRKSMFMDGFPHNECCINEHVFILQSNEIISQAYLFFWFDLPSVTQNIINLNSNAAQPGINQKGVKGLSILVADNNSLNRFDEIAKPILSELFCLAKKNNILRKTRDLLLPKLISGQVDVSELNIHIGES